MGFFSTIIALKQGRSVTRNPRLDRALYKPYKGYNRMRSRSWNKKHTSGC